VAGPAGRAVFAAWSLGSRVPIPLGALMFVFVFMYSVLCCVGRDLCELGTLLHLQRTCSLSLCCASVLPSDDMILTCSFLVFSGFTSRPTSLLASNRVCVSLYGIYVFSHYINVISICQMLMCPIQFHTHCCV
jgi:hypothetical protein